MLSIYLMKTKWLVIALCLLIFGVQSSSEGNKVLIVPLFSGSSLLQMKELGLELVAHNYNTSVLILEDSKFRHVYEGTGINLIFCPGLKQSDFQEIEDKQLKGTGKIKDFLMLTAMIFESTTIDPNWIPYLKSQEFDLLIYGHLPQMNSLAHILDIPHNIVLQIGSPETQILEQCIGAPSHSSVVGILEENLIALPVVGAEREDRSSFKTRFLSYLGGFPSWFVFGYLMNLHPYRLSAQEYKHLIGLEAKNELYLAVSVEGIMNQNSVPPHVKFIYPLSKTQDSFRKEIPGRFISFMNKYERVLLVAFGSTFKPSKEFLEMLLQFEQENSDFGILMSLKNQEAFGEAYNKLVASNDILVSEWLPQKEILASGKISLFYSHGGVNSIMESLEAGVPLLITPLVKSDQQTTCKLIALQGYGYCLEKPTLQQLYKALDLMRESNYLNSTMSHVRKVIKKKKEDPHDLVYWVKQVLEVGTHHLIPKDTLKMNFLALNDLDIHFAMFFVLTIVIVGILIFFVITWKVCFGQEPTKLKKD